MVSTFTPNIQLEEPARGDDVGTWDTPVNANMTLLDSVVGGIATISLNNSPVVLSAAQFKSRQITFNSTLTSNCAITFPTSFTKSYEIQHLCSGSSSFLITLQTTAAGGQAICAAPGEIIEVVNDGVNLKYKNLGRIGTYTDWALSAVPAWVSGCTVPPYLNCDGTAFSSAIYPQLTVFLGTTTLPDSKGRVRAAMDQGAGRLSSATAGFSPNAVGSGGGDQRIQAHTHANTLNDPGHTHGVSGGTRGGTADSAVASGGLTGVINPSAIVISSAVTGISITNASAGSGAAQNVQPTYIGGITMIRAA